MPTWIIYNRYTISVNITHTHAFVISGLFAVPKKIILRRFLSKNKATFRIHISYKQVLPKKLNKGNKRVFNITIYDKMKLLFFS